MKKQQPKFTKNFGIILLLIAFILEVVYLGMYIPQPKQKQQPTVIEAKEEKQEKTTPKEETKEPEPEPEPAPPPYYNILPEVRANYGNPGIMARLEVPNIGIDTYVARADNNSYYLEYNYYNQRDGLGAPFFDYRNVDLNNDKQINIYGHNTQNERFFSVLPFKKLEAYANQDVFNSYKDIYLSIDERQVHYRIIAIKIINDSDNEHMKIGFKSKEDFLNHANRLLQNSLYHEEPLKITAKDRLIVLQVCYYNPPDTYLLVIGKEV